MEITDFTNTVIVGVGVPGCGKTTYLKPFANHHNLAYVNPDSIREELTGDATNHTREPQVWRLVHDRIVRDIPRGVVVDATYSRRRARKELIALCKEHGAKRIIAVWFDIPLDVCKRRNATRERVVPDTALERMHDRLIAHPPTIEEGFTEIEVITETADL